MVMSKKLMIGLLFVLTFLIGVLIYVNVSEEQVLLDYNNPVNSVTKEKILQLDTGLTYEEILKKLGPTKDIGSGLHVAVYLVDEGGTFYLSFSDYDKIVEMDGKAMYEKFHK